MVISYTNTEDRYLQATLDNIHSSKKYWAKDILLRIIVALLFGVLSFTKYTIDMKLFGYLTESASLVILVYSICGLIWIILLPILYWRLKVIIISKEINNMGINFSGDVKYVLEDDKIIIESCNYVCKCNWSEVKKITVKSKVISIMINGYDEFLVSTDVFKDKDEENTFISYIEDKIKKSLEVTNNEEQEV